jgi:hypothetical protein
LGGQCAHPRARSISDPGSPRQLLELERINPRNAIRVTVLTALLLLGARGSERRSSRTGVRLPVTRRHRRSTKRRAAQSRSERVRRKIGKTRSRVPPPRAASELSSASGGSRANPAGNGTMAGNRSRAEKEAATSREDSTTWQHCRFAVSLTASQFLRQQCAALIRAVIAVGTAYETCTVVTTSRAAATASKRRRVTQLA